MDDRPREPGRGPWDDHEREVAELLERAGPRPEVPEEDLEAIAGAARSAWQASWGAEPTREVRWTLHRRRFAAAAALAAALALAVGLGWWWRSLHPSAPPPVVAHLEAVFGSVGLAGEGMGGGGVSPGQPLREGVAVATGGASGPEGRVALRMATGTSVRLDAESRLLLVSASVLELERGTVYLDTGTAAPGGGRVEVHTALGTARDVGTQFMVRVAGPGAEALSVRVREGSVAVERGRATHRAGAGRELVLHKDGRVERRDAPGYGPAWEWVAAAGPAFELEGRSVAELLDWVSRETGWRVLYEDPELAASAEVIVLHGSLGELRADQAPFELLPGAGLEGELRGGVLLVRRGGP